MDEIFNYPILKNYNLRIIVFNNYSIDLLNYLEKFIKSKNYYGYINTIKYYLLPLEYREYCIYCYSF